MGRVPEARRGVARWMEREYHHVIEASKPADSDTGSKAKAAMDEASLPVYTMAQVEKHASRESAWFVHSGHVYDATKFLADHPGGAESILIVAGQARQPPVCAFPLTAVPRSCCCMFREAHTMHVQLVHSEVCRLAQLQPMV